MDINIAADLAIGSIKQVSTHIAEDIDAFAAEIETRQIPMSGPDALRMFARLLRKSYGQCGTKTETAN